jgi:hypothetical protein
VIFRDFRKRGFLFKDITPLLIDRKPQRMPEILVSSLKEKKRQSHRGGESRLFFGMLIAKN